MGESGSVAWMFHKKGYIGIEKSKADEETLMTMAIDAGADDFRATNRVRNLHFAGAFEGTERREKQRHRNDGRRSFDEFPRLT